MPNSARVSSSPKLFKPSDFFCAEPTADTSCSASAVSETASTLSNGDSNKKHISTSGLRRAGSLSSKSVSSSKSFPAKTSQSDFLPKSSSMGLLLPVSTTTTATSPEEPTKPQRNSENKENTKIKVKPAIGLFWDIENCRVPAGKSVLSYVNLIRDKFCKDYCCDEFICVCAVETISERMCEELNNAQVTLAHVPAGAKNAADEKLRQKIRRFGEVFAHRNAAAILITGDINFISDVTDLRHRYGVKVILIHNGHTNEQLKSVANETVLHEDLVSETLDRVVKSGMQLQPQELVIMNLPLHASEISIRQKLSKLCDNCGGKVTFINRAKGFAFVVFGSPEACERAFIRLQNKEVFGNKIQVDLAMRNANQPANYNNNNYNHDRINTTHFTINNTAHYNKNNPPFQPVNKFDGAMAPPRKNNWVAESMANQPSQVLANNLSFNVYGDVSFSTPNGSNTFPRTPNKGSRGGTGDRNMDTSPFRNQNCASNKPTTPFTPTKVATPKPVARQLVEAPKVVIKDEDVCALMVASRLDCHSFKDKIKAWLSKHLKQQNIPFKTEYSTNPSLKHCFIICCKSQTDLTIARNVLLQFSKKSGGVLQLKPESIRYDVEPLCDFRCKVEQLIDHNLTQLHTFFLNYWQKHGILFKPSELNFLTDLIEISEDSAVGMKYISRRTSNVVEVDVDEEEPMTFKYIEPLLKKASAASIPEKAFDPYDQNNFTLLDVSDDDCGKNLASEKAAISDSFSNAASSSPYLNLSATVNTNSSFPEGKSDLKILFNSFNQIPIHRCPEMKQTNFVKFPNLSLAEFSDHVYELLSQHDGIIPTPQFLNCYKFKFGKLASEVRIPFEQLLLSVDGVSTFYNGTKCVCFSSLDTSFKEYYSDVRAPMPLVASKTNEFINEVLRQLEMAKLQSYKIKLSSFLASYFESKGRQFDSNRYGFNNARELFLACRGYFTVLGVGTDQTICYSRRLNIKRFGSFLATGLNLNSQSSLNSFLNSHVQLPCNPLDYGLCYHKDLSDKEFLELAISTLQSQPTRFEMSSEIVRDMTHFSHKVFIVMSVATRQTLSVNNFYSSFHQTFNKNINAVDFGFTDLKELLLATELVWITDSSEDATKIIMMRPLIKLFFEIFNLMKKNSWCLLLRDIPRNYERAYGKKLMCYRHGFPTLEKLMQSLPSFVKLTQKGIGFNGELHVILAPSFKEVVDKCDQLSPNPDSVTTSLNRMCFNQGLRNYYQDAPPVLMQTGSPSKPNERRAPAAESMMEPSPRLTRNGSGVKNPRGCFGDCLEGPQMPSGETSNQFSIPLPPHEFLKNL